ncbi:MAG: phosphoenolpyruvate--protein phosphotransferase [Bryobacteraceae bacterium]
MIGLVIVSHSAKLAEGVCDLARQVAQGQVRIAAAGGTADPENPIGTDAFQVLQAIESVYSEDGVLVLMDLGSAVLSAGTALELLGEARRSRVELCAAPLVEGAVAAASLAAAGAGLAEIACEARNALAGKVAQLGAGGEPTRFGGPAGHPGEPRGAVGDQCPPGPAPLGPGSDPNRAWRAPREAVAVGEPLADARGSDPSRAWRAPGPEGTPGVVPGAAEDAGLWEEALVQVPNRLGLHARPAAQLVRLTRRYGARVTLENVSQRTGPAAGDSINAVLGLGAQQGHQLRIRAQGPAAHEALAALVIFIESGCGEKKKVAKDIPAPAEDHSPAEDPSPEDGPDGVRWGRRFTCPSPPMAGESPALPALGQLGGIPASAGIAIGPLVKLRLAAVELTPRPIGNPDAERQRLMSAIGAAQEETRALYEWSKAQLGADEAGIFDAQSLFLEDPELIGGVARRLAEERAGAESAWQAETARLADRLGALDDPYLRARAADVTDVAARVFRRLTGQTGGVRVVREPAILTAHDLTPSEVANLDPATALGLCLETGSASAHSVILARARGIPVVAGLGPGISALADGTMVAVDGEQGTVWIAPDAGKLQALEERRQNWLAARRAAELERSKPAATRDGHRIRVLANISGVAEAAEAVACGAEGVGVLRTEFLFLGRAAAPGEEEQVAAYGAIAGSLGGRPLTVRTLDIGGDKSLPYVEIGEEANPFLGWRGIRVMLSRRDLFRTQLRAILRAGAAQAVELLLPMIATLDELREAKAVLREAEAELEREGWPFRKDIRVGVMIEVPAAVAVADRLAREASFFSIGSNDLIQYVMAADRTNSRVAPMADPFQPAVLRMIRQTIAAARGAAIGVALCGELAADPLATPLLLGLGLEEFSVSAPLIPELKRAISRWSAAEAEGVAREALGMDSSQAVRRLLLEAAGRLKRSG